MFGRTRASDAQLRRLYLEMRQVRASVEDLYDDVVKHGPRSLWYVYASTHPVVAVMEANRAGPAIGALELVQ